jgi:hypothetical protein
MGHRRSALKALDAWDSHAAVWVVTLAADFDWRELALLGSILGGAVVILLGVILQIWIPAVQLRRIAAIFAERPAAADRAFTRVLDVYGWRGRLACKLFRIQIPTARPTAYDGLHDDAGRAQA